MGTETERRHLACIRPRRPADGPAGGTPAGNAGWKPALPFVLLALLLAACNSHGHTHEDGEDHEDVEEHRDQWRPREAQSDFLDIGKQAGIEWLSFVPQDQLEYPEYFEGLDRDQRRRVRLAPKGSDEQVLLQFDLPEGSKLWPVDWYGTELMAIDHPEFTDSDLSVALASPTMSLADATSKLAVKRQQQLERSIDSLKGQLRIVLWENTGEATLYDGDAWIVIYIGRELPTKAGSLLALFEIRRRWTMNPVPKRPSSYPVAMNAVDKLPPAISIKRELALEGSPKHKCSSSLEEQLRGTLRFPDGTLQLPIESGQLVRKIGGDSTIQIDGEGAKPWILIRRLKEAETEGDLRARLRRDTTFNRRLKVPSAKFSTGYVPQDAKLPIVVFDYDDSSSENNLLGVLKAGNELLTFEVITQGVTDGDRRRAAKAAALKLLAGATGTPETQAPEFKPLIDWNAGDMGK